MLDDLSSISGAEIVERVNLPRQAGLWVHCVCVGVLTHTYIYTCTRACTYRQNKQVIILKKLSTRAVMLCLAYNPFCKLETELNAWFMEFSIKWNYRPPGLKIIEGLKMKSSECETKVEFLLITGACLRSRLCLSGRMDGTVSETASSSGQLFSSFPFNLLRRY